LCELEIVPEIEEGNIATPTAHYVRERKRLSRRRRTAEGVFVAAVVVAHCVGLIG
jgi:tellurite resistance protein